MEPSKKELRQFEETIGEIFNNYHNNNELTPREQKILEDRYGFKSVTTPKTLLEVGEEFGLTKKQVKKSLLNSLNKIIKSL